ncbi:MAG TPA: disulfide bond formation protein B [Methylophilaceae bacterium]|nr:disulfide bond formation protein B [Methylophilaceae bacterium]
MLNKILTGRSGYLLGFIASFGLVALALYLQQRYTLEPCPLCIFQRIAFLALGVLFLAAAIHNPAQTGRRLYGLLQVTAALVGAGIALRHMWIQANPDKVMTECGAGIDYIFETLPFSKALNWVFKGTGECSSMDWTFFGLTIPQLSLIGFVVLGIYAVLLAVKKKA